VEKRSKRERAQRDLAPSPDRPGGWGEDDKNEMNGKTILGGRKEKKVGYDRGWKKRRGWEKGKRGGRRAVGLVAPTIVQKKKKMEGG